MIRETVRTDKAPKAIGPYEQAIKVGDFIYTAGQIPLDPKTGNLVEGGIAAQTRQVLENLKAVLEAGGSSLDRVVKATVFLKNIGDFASMNEVYAEYLGQVKPARSSRSILLRLREAEQSIRFKFRSTCASASAAPFWRHFSPSLESFRRSLLRRADRQTFPECP